MERDVDVNLTAVFILTQAVLPDMLAKGRDDRHRLVARRAEPEHARRRRLRRGEGRRDATS